MKKLSLIITIASAAIILISCRTGNKPSGAGNKKITITAAGATFPMPFYNQIFEMYTKNTGILVTYGGIGSGGGIRSLADKVVDFGATDAYLEDDKIKEMPADVVHIPTCLGAVVIAYNMPGVDGLKLTENLLEGIFMGKITKWNDPVIKDNNKELQLPDKDILVVHRSDGSGTTNIFSDYMSKISPLWKEKVGAGKSLDWPAGIGAKGNPGVAGTISQTEGAIGYIGSEYAFAQKIQVAKVRNSSGNYISPSVESISAAAKGTIPDDTRAMITNTDDPEGYPISGFTWLILYKEQSYDGRSKAQATETLNLLNWIISPEAQEVTKNINYSPLPDEVVEKAKNILKSVTYKGDTLMK
jgi:phosphate transport system substrate-binding protein